MGILEGIRVLEMGHVVAAPSATVMMADWGAEVIKLEPLNGELFRRSRRSHGVDLSIKYENGEMNWVIQLFNRNKKSIAVNMKNKSGRDIIYKLVENVDVFISNYELANIKKLEVNYAKLRQLNPKLVYCLVTGYGTNGPLKDERGFDYTAAWASTGAQYLIGEPDSCPIPPRFGMMDRMVASNVVAGVLAALLHREKTGNGQELECSLYHSGVWCMSHDIQSALVGTPMHRHIRIKATNPLVNQYCTKDKRWIQLSMIQSDLSWPGFCQAIGRPDLEKAPNFNNQESREQNSEELIHTLDIIFASCDLEEWEKRLKKYSCIFARVATISEVISDPQAVANNFFVEIKHPFAGTIKLVNTPVNFKQHPAVNYLAAPELGQHTEEVLLSLGYSRIELNKFKDEGVIL